MDEKALKYLYRLISQRDYTEKTLRDKLRKKGFSSNVINNSLNRLKELGYLDQENFIRNYINSSIKKLYGPARIKSKLYEKGIDYSETEAVLEEIYDYETIKRNLEILRLKNKKDKEKFIAFCIRRGFSLRDILDSLKDD